MTRQMLILDFDGVIADTEPIHFIAWNQVFEETYGVTVAGDHHLLVGLSLDEIYDLWLSQSDHKISLTEKEKQSLLKRKTEIFYQVARERLRPMDGCVELVRQAQSNAFYTSIVSRALRMRLLRTLRIIKLPAMFDIVLGSEDCVDPTTDKKVHSKAPAVFDIDPLDCIVIEDSASGVSAAKACGIGRVIGLTTSIDADTLCAAGADEVVNSLREVRL